MSPSLTKQIRTELAGLCPDEVILFGSRAGADADVDSDLDLVVVLPRDEDPASFHERMELVHQVREHLRSLEDRYALDLLVFTRPQWKRFVEKKSWFSQQVTTTGQRIA